MHEKQWVLFRTKCMHRTDVAEGFVCGSSGYKVLKSADNATHIF